MDALDHRSPTRIWPGLLALTLVVRDEEDILAANIDYHLAQGVDVILALDHGSSDRTPEILRRYEQTGRVRSFRDDARPHDQARRVNLLLRIAAEDHDADWVIHCDADEFWMPTLGSLRDVFATIPEQCGYIEVKRHNFLPAPANGDAFHPCSVIRHRNSRNLRGTDLEPKIAQRPAASSAVAPGNHFLESPRLDPAPDIGALEVLHFPIRTFEQFERKVVATGVGYERLVPRPADVGCDQLELLAIWRRGALRDYYDSEALDPRRIEQACAAGDLVVDPRLQSFLAAGPIAVGESQALQELLRRAWSSAAVLDQAGRGHDAALAELRAERDLADLTCRELEARLEQALAETDDTRRTLEIIRSSRIMRHTASARRLYYRLRRPRA
jgi:hypothetical protein